MTDMSTQIIWKQPWNNATEAKFREILFANGCSLEELTSQTWDATTATIGGVRDYLCSYLAPASTPWSTVLLHFNAQIANVLGPQISKAICGPCVVLTEYGQRAWGYTVYQNGEATAKFLNRPEYLEQEPSLVSDSPGTLAQVFDAPISEISPYLRHLGMDESAEFKVFPDDEFELGNHWVRTDLLKRLGVRYPTPGHDPYGKYVRILETQKTNAEPQTGESKTMSASKPWWKIW